MTNNSISKADPNEILGLRNELRTADTLCQHHADAKTDVHSNLGREVIEE
jgi:hypothetical protein